MPKLTLLSKPAPKTDVRREIEPPVFDDEILDDEILEKVLLEKKEELEEAKIEFSFIFKRSKKVQIPYTNLREMKDNILFLEDYVAFLEEQLW